MLILHQPLAYPCTPTQSSTALPHILPNPHGASSASLIYAVSLHPPQPVYHCTSGTPQHALCNPSYLQDTSQEPVCILPSLSASHWPLVPSHALHSLHGTFYHPHTPSISPQAGSSHLQVWTCNFLPASSLTVVWEAGRRLPH